MTVVRCTPGCLCGRHRRKKCEPGCSCNKHISRPCEPGCTCGVHTSLRRKCSVDCTCKKCTPCPEGCECLKHISRLCKEGCGCSAHVSRPCKEGCSCGRHENSRCPVGCTCKKHSGRKCEPGCTCAKHSMLSCEPTGCGCGKHLQEKHPPGCSCRVHDAPRDPCPPGCNCGRNQRCPEGCTCLRHFVSDETRQKMSAGHKRRLEAYTTEEYQEYVAEISERLKNSYLGVFALFGKDLRRRDGDLCQLCLEPIDFTLPWSSPLGRSVDHIIPSSMGGPDELFNMWLAHRGCNSRKRHFYIGRVDGTFDVRRTC